MTECLKNIHLFVFTECSIDVDCDESLACLPVQDVLQIPGQAVYACLNPCAEDFCLNSYGPGYECRVIFHVPQCIPRQQG